MSRVKQKVIGGIITIIIGGTGAAISQADVAERFANETGMTASEVSSFVEDMKTADFNTVGEELVLDSDQIKEVVVQINCYEYIYEWEDSNLSCEDGKSQLDQIANNEYYLGQCYKSLDTDLGSSAKSAASRCISLIDDTVESLDYPIISKLYPDESSVEETKKINLYNKSLLSTFLEASK